jgi:hypothetical protein
MDDFTVKPRDSTSRIGPGRQASPVRTELAPAQSVTASSSSAPRGGGPQGEADSSSSPHDFLLAPQSQKVIDREREVSRRPRRASDQALLRMRAYGQSLRTDDDEPENQADLEA